MSFPKLLYDTSGGIGCLLPRVPKAIAPNCLISRRTDASVRSTHQNTSTRVDPATSQATPSSGRFRNRPRQATFPTAYDNIFLAVHDPEVLILANDRHVAGVEPFAL
jgi:hypothetical protein